ncbi:Iso-IS1 ORF2 [Shigella sonnei]|nr:Iso-IS1 ORF2 [Shigella sonnei]
MATVTVHCPRCHSDEVYRHGRSCSRHERFRCRSCKRVFQLTYSYEARKPGVKEQIVEMAHNGAGGRDTARTKLPPRRITSAPVAHADVALICELDEQWRFVGSKAATTLALVCVQH